MKTFKPFFILTLTCLLLSCSLYSQYWLTNGNSAFPTDFLGTTNIQNLNFKTNSQFRMRLMNNTGYLGVGSQSFTPSASLHLNLLSYSINSGNLIRTDGRSNLNLTWTMFSGTNVGNSVQRARFLLSPNTITQTNSLEVLAEALKYFYRKTGTRVTYEYIVFKDFNDTLEDARELLEFCQHVPCKVNIIEYNPIDGGIFQQADPEKVDAFAAFLEENHQIVNVRRSRGKDIDAACGQLANKNKAVLKESVLKPGA